MPLTDGREDVDGTGLERDVRTLGVLALADAELRARRLTSAVERVHGVDLDVEDLFDGELDLRLVGAGINLEGVLAIVGQPVAPPLFNTMVVLGRARVISRLRRAIPVVSAGPVVG